MDASCKAGTGAKTDPYKPCELDTHDCMSPDAENDPWGAYVAFSNCDYKPLDASCPENFVITQEEIIQGGPMIPDSSPEAFETYSKKINIPKGGVCMMEISVEDRAIVPAKAMVPAVVEDTATGVVAVAEVPAVAELPASKKNGGFGASEW